MPKEIRQDTTKQRPQTMQDSIDLLRLSADYLRHWWIILLCLLVGAGLGWGHTYLNQVTTYTSESLIYVNINKVSLGSTSISVSDFSSSVALANRYTVAIQSRRVLEKAIAEHDLHYTYGQLKSIVSVKAMGETEFLSVQATLTDPVEAAKVTNAVTESLIEIMNTLVEGNNAVILDKGQIPTVGNGPGFRRNAMVGGLLGAALCIGVLTLLYLMDNTVKNQEDLYQIYRIPVLSSVPDHAVAESGGYNYGYGKKKKTVGKKRNFCGWDSMSFSGQEAYKLLRTNVEFSFPKEKVDASGRHLGRVVGITSSRPNEYKSTTVVNLAIALAESQKKVLLLDCDLRKTDIVRRLELHGKKGISDFLVAGGNPDDMIHHGVVMPNLDVFSGGTYPPNPSELLGSRSMVELVNQMSLKYDFIIVDLPPLAEVSDALVAGRFCDGMLMVIREAFTSRKDLEQSFREIEYAKLRLLGLVLTGDAQHATFKKYNYYKGYSYGYRHKGKS